MEINTRFNMNQEVYFLHDNIVVRAEVVRIDVTVMSEGRTWKKYEVRALSGGQLFTEKVENTIFASKAELIASL
jgi:hypothetical protein